MTDHTDNHAAAGSALLKFVNYIAAAIALHVQSCFTKERILCEMVDSLETVQEINDFNIAEQWNATP